jgi:hypothetical protein
VLALLPAALLAREVMPLERLMQSASRYPAPAALQAHMQTELRADLARCQSQEHYTTRQLARYFAARKLDLTKTREEVWLVFPSRYCAGLFGAHSVPFWLMQRLPDGRFLELLAGAEDAVEVLDQRHDGWRDIGLRYGQGAPAIHQFNGSRYEEVERCNDCGKRKSAGSTGPK